MFLHKAIKPVQLFVNHILTLLRDMCEATSIAIDEGSIKDLQWFIACAYAINNTASIYKCVQPWLDLFVDALLHGLEGPLDACLNTNTMSPQPGYSIAHWKAINIYDALQVFAPYIIFFLLILPPLIPCVIFDGGMLHFTLAIWSSSPLNQVPSALQSKTPSFSFSPSCLSSLFSGSYQLLLLLLFSFITLLDAWSFCLRVTFDVPFILFFPTFTIILISVFTLSMASFAYSSWPIFLSHLISWHLVL
jgi:hypothetical protein